MRRRILYAIAIFAVPLFNSNSQAVEGKAKPALSKSKLSSSAFEAMVPVLHHPRCMNCHSGGDFPRQGDDSHRHNMDVLRGREGDGVNGVKCSTCHQDHNLRNSHAARRS